MTVMLMYVRNPMIIAAEQREDTSVSVRKVTGRISYLERDQAGVDDGGAVIGGFGGVGVGALPPGCPPSAGVVVPVPGG